MSYRDQRLLHDFFKPYKPLTEDELLAHRRAVTKARPELPAQAGKAYHRFIHGPAVPPTVHHGKRHTITMRGIANPELDIHKLSQALLAIAEDMAREEQGRKSDLDPRQGDVEDHLAA